MCPEKTLKRRNLEKITTNSTATDAIAAQQKELAVAERKLGQADRRLSKVREKMDLARDQAADARKQHASRDTGHTRRALNTAITKLQNIRQDLEQLLSETRELKLIVRGQRNLVKSLEKKEAAKQKAVARFLKDWERDYDRKMRMKEKTLEKRKRLI